MMDASLAGSASSIAGGRLFRAAAEPQDPALTEPVHPLDPRAVHSLGISQILSYGLMFYAFAALKTPVAAATSLGDPQF